MITSTDRRLTDWLKWVATRFPGEIAFIVLYGSRARGDFKPHSDYDLLIGLSGETPRDARDFMTMEYPGMEPKPFTPAQIEQLWFHYHRMLLDPLYEGVVLRDDGTFAAHQARFEETRQRGIIERQGRSWLWHQDREPAESPRHEAKRRDTERLRALMQAHHQAG